MPRCLLPQRLGHHADTRSVFKVTKYEMNKMLYLYMPPRPYVDLCFQAENIMLLELDMSPPTMFTLNFNGAHLERAFCPSVMNTTQRERSSSLSRVRKSQSW